MKTRYILASLSLVGLFASCQNEEFVAEQTNNVLKGRPTVNLTLEKGVNTRLVVGDNDAVGYNSTDELGAVIVDGQTLWSINTGHVGNNKFYYDETSGKFVTKGTTAIGSWVFYTQYSSDMTTQRDAITYSFKQIQEGDATSTASTATGVDFFVSPIVQLDGYEGEDLAFSVQTPSINTRAVIDLAFDASLDVTEVQKIVVAAKSAGGSPTQFILKGKIDNMKLKVADVRSATLVSADKTANEVILEAAQKMSNVGAYNATTLESDFSSIVEAQGVANDQATFLALDCISHDENATAMPVINNEFKSIMLLPADKYKSLTLYVYTNKGIYKKEIKNPTPENEQAVDADFWLRRGHRVNLANITKSASAVTEKLSIKEANLIENSVAATETDGTVVLKTADLIAAINAIQTDGDVEINVIGDANHQTIINKAVMDALIEVKNAKPNVQLIFSTPMNIEGTSDAAAPLDLHDITFEEGATLTAGYAVVNSDINIPATKNITVTANTTLTFAEAANENLSYVYTGLVNKGTVNVGASISIGTITNLGVISIDEEKALTTTADVINNGIVTNNGTWNIKGNTENTVTDASAATINNFGIINIKGATANSNIINNGKQTTSGATITAEGKGIINVMETFANKGIINNYKSSVILVKTGDAASSALNNESTATINNYGDLYCNEGSNTINNVGSIYAEPNSTTYITTNTDDASSDYTTTNTANMGEIFLNARNSDVSVTTVAKKGYISFAVPSSVSKIDAQSGDKFNKVYLKGKCEVASPAVKYVVADAGTDEVILTNSQYAELTFNTDATIYADPVTKVKVGKLSVAKDVRVKLPTENAMGVYEVDFTTTTLTDKCKTSAKIENKGTILVGGNFWSSLSLPSSGTFASGDGNTSAFHWGEVSWN